MVSIEHPITNYLGLSNVTGRQMAEAFTKQMEEAGIEITEQTETEFKFVPTKNKGFSDIIK